MTRMIFLTISIVCFIKAESQSGYIVLKKRDKVIHHFWKEGHFTFQTNDGEWLTGIITEIRYDSFYFTKEIIRYHFMGNDTLHFTGFRFSLKDVKAIPRNNEEIVYDND